ncbi:hypothetical protein chiPu_0002957 [Chiloscyllium punctatum]|uniref:Peptidase S8/S53 domain-containing protein n=1 Tax=Chiloscyllium punctatum TaxID=137246 RepID=A0A401S2B6_CHIPU|nr:hypothetical protein [Chiloscyllium punctatum]
MCIPCSSWQLAFFSVLEVDQEESAILKLSTGKVQSSTQLALKALTPSNRLFNAERITVLVNPVEYSLIDDGLLMQMRGPLHILERNIESCWGFGKKIKAEILPVGNLKGFHILKATNKQFGKRIRKRSAEQLLQQLSQDRQVKWAEQQVIHEVEKRDKALLPDLPFLSKEYSISSFFETLDREKHDTIPAAIFNVLKSEQEDKDALQFNDPMWPAQWELFNTGQTHGPKGFDINVMPVWKKNITGSGIVVTIIDDGIDHDHIDLKRNYVSITHTSGVYLQISLKLRLKS